MGRICALEALHLPVCAGGAFADLDGQARQNV